MIGIQHPWHDITSGDKIPQIVTAIIEIPNRSRAKYEVNKVSGLIKLDRILFPAMYYPANYGFIPQTYYRDGDPLDILVLCSEDLVPLTVVDARVLGILEMTDGNEKDNKIIAVAEKDPSLMHIKNVEDLPAYTLDEIRNFFEEYKKMEGKVVKVTGFKNKKYAFNCIKESIAAYISIIKPGLRQET